LSLSHPYHHYTPNHKSIPSSTPLHHYTTTPFSRVKPHLNPHPQIPSNHHSKSIPWLQLEQSQYNLADTCGHSNVMSSCHIWCALYTFAAFAPLAFIHPPLKPLLPLYFYCKPLSLTRPLSLSHPYHPQPTHSLVLQRHHSS